MRRFALAVVAAALAVSLAAPALAQGNASGCRQAYDPKDGQFGTVLKRVGCIAGFISPEGGGALDSATETGIALIVGRIVGYLLAFVGVVFIILMIHGGWLWMSAQGNEEQVTKAQAQIRSAVIGIIVVFSAFVISYAVLGAITYGLDDTVSP
jgi:uncharacterized iron-regulated membrane protein